MLNNVISLFSGAGGLDYGLEAAGFETSVCTDYNTHACNTLRHNRPWSVLEGDISLVEPAELLARAGVVVGDVALLAGGPPCQPFSKSGFWASGESRRLDDPRAATLTHYIRMVDGTLPKVMLLENVEGLSYAGKSEGVQFLLTALEGINQRHGTNYQASFKVLKAADYGVPQHRARFFLVAERSGREFAFPSPTHGDSDGLQPFRTAWDAIGDLSGIDHKGALDPTGKWAALLPTVPEGSNYLWHTDRGGGFPLFGWRRRYWSFLLKLAKALPSWTIQAQPGPATGPFHWDSRRLSMRELARLQTFPDDVEVTGSLREVQRQIGNAVPSLLTEVVGRAIRDQLLGHEPSDEHFRLIPPVRTPVPDAEEVPTLLPEKYQNQVGEHSSHPGTGLGRRASRRPNGVAGPKPQNPDKEAIVSR